MKTKPANFIVLDLGSNKIAGIAAHIDRKGDAKVLSQTLYHSKGFKSGVITDLTTAEESILNVVYTLEKECGTNITNINLSLPGIGAKSYYVNHTIKLPYQPITKQDINKLIQKALVNIKLQNQNIINYFPIEFTVDNDSIVENPIGIFAKELSCQLHIVAIDQHILINLLNCFSKCSINVDNIYLAIYTSALACLSEDEKNLGCLFINIGSKTTTFGVFLGGKLIYSGYIPLGSWHITYDIAKVFSVSINTAEKLKVLYGNAYHSTFEKDSVINMDDLDSDAHYHLHTSITIHKLGQVINARFEEIMLCIKEEYDKTDLDSLIARRLILSGGGAMLKGVKEVSGNIFEKQTRIGKPLIIPGFAEDYNSGVYASAVGLIQNQITLQKQKFLESKKYSDNENILHRTINWLRENI